MHKSDGSWTGARAIGCLPGLTGNVGIPGGGFGPRHGGAIHGQALSGITAEDRRPPGAFIPSQIPRVTEAMLDGRLRVMLLLGTNMLSSYADAGRVAEALGRMDLIVAYDLFFSDTARGASSMRRAESVSSTLPVAVDLAERRSTNMERGEGLQPPHPWTKEA
jgi:anaerobic selenocysteine-containing dehydrogenase